MIKNGKILALITARGGSKRLPRKNILKLADKPLIAWTIESALESKYIDRVVVSTDDDEIASISRCHGADVPFVRPPEFSTDKASSIEVIRHAVGELERLGDAYEYLVLLQPTSPLRNASHIDTAIELFVSKNANCVVSVCEIDHPIEWTGLLPDDCSIDDFFSDGALSRRSQDFQKRYRLNGAIYIVNIRQALEQNSLLLKESGYGFVMKRHDSVDIDEYVDFLYAEVLAKVHTKSAG